MVKTDIETFRRLFLSKSTSFHHINGDRVLTQLEKRKWFFYNHLNNIQFPFFIKSSSFEQLDFHCKIDDAAWARLDQLSSPSRSLSDLFWMTLPWDRIQSELQSIRVFDIGCGKGGYCEKINAWSSGRIDGYDGFDIKSNPYWDVIHQKFPWANFSTLASPESIPELKQDTSFIMTQSALEHFEEDLAFFQQLQKMVLARKKNTIQVHLFPSAACINIYRLHGVRQYTPRSVVKIIRLFAPFSYSYLFKLGGKTCNDLHKEYITIPIKEGRGDQRPNFPEEYNSKMRSAIQKDMASPQKEPSFYALFIHSFNNSKIDFSSVIK